MLTAFPPQVCPLRTQKSCAALANRSRAPADGSALAETDAAAEAALASPPCAAAAASVALDAATKLPARKVEWPA